MRCCIQWIVKKHISWENKNWKIACFIGFGFIFHLNWWIYSLFFLFCYVDLFAAYSKCISHVYRKRLFSKLIACLTTCEINWYLQFTWWIHWAFMKIFCLVVICALLLWSVLLCSLHLIPMKPRSPYVFCVLIAIGWSQCTVKDPGHDS